MILEGKLDQTKNTLEVLLGCQVLRKDLGIKWIHFNVSFHVQNPERVDVLISPEPNENILKEVRERLQVIGITI